MLIKMFPGETFLLQIFQALLNFTFKASQVGIFQYIGCEFVL
jgi:hypothetical protein